jgi:hypothetical protein
MFVNLFRKESDDYARYWISISTAVYDKKKKKQTDEYINASMPVRLVGEAVETFDECAKKSKSKGVKYGRFEIDEALFEAVHPKDEDYSYVRLVIFKMKEAEEN